MVPDTPNPLDQLLPDRHPQPDFFICDVADAVLKDLIPTMEHPFYALSKKPVQDIRRYEHGEHWLEVIPSVKGQATIYDKDILIYVVSQIMHKLNRGEPVKSRVLRFNPRDLLIFVNRSTGGADYEAFCEALDRLMGTTIKTNITTHNEDSDIPMGDEEGIGFFHLIDRAHVKRKRTPNGDNKGRIMWAEIEISEWIFNSIRRKSVLTLHRDYFRLRKPIERRVYEIARKLCGSRREMSIGLEKLLKRTGARSELKRFRHSIRDIAKHNHLPDYDLSFDSDRDMVIFRNRGMMPERQQKTLDFGDSGIPIDPSPALIEKARRAVPGWDIYALYREWRSFALSLAEPPRSIDGAFLGFCKKRRKDAP